MNLIKNESPREDKARSKAPAHEKVYQRLRALILFGELAPGQAVTIQGLTESLGAGMTPVREALRRLISDGALVFQDNRRVSVPVLTGEDLEQIVHVRKSIESELIRRATTRLGKADIRQLEKIDAALDGAISAGDVPGYLQRNFDFHAYLYDLADAPIMTDLAERLWLRFGPSLRVVCGRFGTQNLPDRHKEMLDALRRRDPEAAALAMQQDIQEGMSMVTEMLN